MAKLILSMDGLVLNEVRLKGERTTIGRKPTNDIVIDNLAVSGEHAVIVTILNDSFLEDLDSTNGTHVNGHPIKKHFLQDNDVIELGKYKLKFLTDKNPHGVMANLGQEIAPLDDDGMALRAVPKRVDPSQTVSVAASEPAGQATIQILNGPNAGRELSLTKSLTTLGRPGQQVAVITRRPEGYFMTHVEGQIYPEINGRALGDAPQRLANHDVLQLAGTKMEFFYK